MVQENGVVLKILVLIDLFPFLKEESKLTEHCNVHITHGGSMQKVSVYISPKRKPTMHPTCAQTKKAAPKCFPHARNTDYYGSGESATETVTSRHQYTPLPSHQSSIQKNYDPKNWLIRNLPYSHETLLENIIDPAHVPVSHHGTQGFNRKNSAPLFFETGNANACVQWIQIVQVQRQKQIERKKSGGGFQYCVFAPQYSYVRVRSVGNQDEFDSDFNSDNGGGMQIVLN
eukprot:TRINITY_DN10516_c2_g1_i1.p2 TRINITY_DN10516_c2_g1~~TRINITY_DN10516_c2_g1_i1.p2  ORF type:complete len:230 (+),score=31.24 TRINITY_DN10516_c2_g1_i1:102-791(+)